MPLHADFRGRRFQRFRQLPGQSGILFPGREGTAGRVADKQDFFVFNLDHRGIVRMRRVSPEHANRLYLYALDCLRKQYQIHTEAGVFGAHMDVQLNNDGPFTILLDTAEL